MTSHPHPEDLVSSWKRTTTHLSAARRLLSALVDGVDTIWIDECLHHNELGLAFDALVDRGDEADMAPDFWRCLDQAAQEMQLYTADLSSPYAAAAATCQHRLATS